MACNTLPYKIAALRDTHRIGRDDGAALIRNSVWPFVENAEEASVLVQQPEIKMPVMPFQLRLGRHGTSRIKARPCKIVVGDHAAAAVGLRSSLAGRKP